MKLKKIIRIVTICAVVLLLNLNVTFADVGSFDRYDSGSSSSGWSSSSSDWGSSSSSWDYDGGSSSGGYYGGTFINFGSPEFIIIAIIVIAAIIFIKNYAKKKNGNDNNQFNYQNTMPVYTTSVHDVPQSHEQAEKIKAIDPLFSEEEFLSWTKDLYVKMQHAWTERKWEEMRPLETEKLFEQHNAQIQEYIRNKTINVVERIAVNYATIYSFRQTEEKDIVDVALKATKRDYIIDEKTGNVVQGNKNQDRITVYKMTFERTKGTLTAKGKENLDAKNCPNCGAPLKFTSSGKCEYCGSIVSTGVHDWVLSNLEPFRY